MREERPVDHRFKPNLNYHRTADTKGHRKANWMGTPVGRGLRIIIGRIGDRLAPNVDVSRSFNEACPPRILFRELKAICPYCLEWYKEQTGNELKAKVAWDRWHKMYYDNGEPRELRGKMSKEHYRVNPLVSSWWAKVDALMVRKTVITLEDLLEVVQ